MAKNPPANTGQIGQSLGREDLLEKEMAVHTSVLAREIPWTEEPGGLQAMGSQSVRHNFSDRTTASQNTLAATRSWKRRRRMIYVHPIFLIYPSPSP